MIENLAHVHHILVYICAALNETQVNNSVPCIGNVGESLDECRGGEIIASWAVGGGVSNMACLVTKYLAFEMCDVCMNFVLVVCCRTLSIQRMSLILLVVQEIPGFLSWRYIMTTQI